MSKVALIVGTLGESKVEVVKLLRSYLRLELWRIVELAGSGRPMIERKLFDRADPTFASSLQVVLSQLEKFRIHYDAYEILDEQPFRVGDESKFFRLDATKLRNIVDAEEESIRQQIELGELESGN